MKTTKPTKPDRASKPAGLAILCSVAQRRLVEQIASMVEKAYRRGFQQAVEANVSNIEAYKFRYELRTRREQISDTYHQASTPPWYNKQHTIKSGTTVLHRLEIECPQSFYELRELIDGVNRQTHKPHHDR